eukprot:TRINITY_DN630_c0_g1_i2.p1 TRINITY_DN630_c0_g1~~TRINITY_DN630_c0_g1_i2.p1  ORF type:complete len:215 (-),score=4.90 TRINITY_DN630_c0_g1_i2:99-743(-)
MATNHLFSQVNNIEGLSDDVCSLFNLEMEFLLEYKNIFADVALSTMKPLELDETQEVSKEEPTVDEPCIETDPVTPKKTSFDCPKCEKTFRSPGNLRRHAYLHIGDKPFTCEECSRSFARKYDLKVHMRTHTKEKPYMCSFEDCKKRFSRSSSTREHERNIHNIVTTKKQKLSLSTSSALSEDSLPEMPQLSPELASPAPRRKRSSPAEKITTT